METEEKKECMANVPEAEEKRKTSSAAPFLKSKETTASIMRDVVIALTPAALFGIYRFGFRAFLILLLSVTSCVLTEHVCKRIRKVQNGGYECSAVVTGLLFGMMLPVNVPYWFPVAGGMFAIGFVKMLFGGLGRNRLNPAATAMCLFFLFGVGMVGEINAFLLLLGGVYLLFVKVISWHIPATYLVSFSVVTAVFGGYGADMKGLATQLCVGGVMLGAFFLATDYTTSPLTKPGKLIYGVILGGLTGVLRLFEFTTEAVVLAVLCGNVLVPLIDKIKYTKH